MKLQFCYVVTCENLDGSDVKVSGECYHEYENAVDFLEHRADQPQPTDDDCIWQSAERIYKIHVLTFGD